jgi:hypothetical protein
MVYGHFTYFALKLERWAAHFELVVDCNVELINQYTHMYCSDREFHEVSCGLTALQFEMIARES